MPVGRIERLFAGMAAALAAFGTAVAQEPLRIVIVPAEAPAAFWQAARQGAEEAAESLGVTLEVAEPGSNGLADAVDGSPDGVVASIPDADRLAPALARAAEAGVPLVTIGEGFDVARALGARLHVGQDEAEAGRRAGEAMRQLGAHNAVCLAASPLSLAQDMRCKGLAEVFDRAVALLPVAGGLEAIEAALTERLEADTSIDAIVSVAGGEAGEAAVAAVQALDLGERVHVAAFDPGPGFMVALAGGQAAFAVDQQPRLQGWLAVALLASHARGGGLPVDDIRTGPRIVTPAEARAGQAPAD